MHAADVLRRIRSLGGPVILVTSLFGLPLSMYLSGRFLYTVWDLAWDAVTCAALASHVYCCGCVCDGCGAVLLVWQPPPPPPPSVATGALTQEQKRDMFVRFNAAVLSKTRQDDSKARKALRPPVKAGDAHWLAMWQVIRELSLRCDDQEQPAMGPHTSPDECHGMLALIRLQLLSSVDEDGAQQTENLLHQAMADKVVRAQVAELEGTPEYEAFVNNPELVAKYKEHVLEAQRHQRKNFNPLLDDDR